MLGLQTLAVMLVFGHGVLACDNMGLMRCIQTMTSKAGALSAEGLSGGLPTADQINQACELFDDFKACYEPFISGCRDDSSKQMMMGFNVIRGMTDYMCGEGKQGLVDNADCYAKQAVKDGIATCTANQKRRQEDLKNEAQSGSMDQEEMIESTCRMMTSSKNCIVNAISASCPGDAATVAAEFTDRSFKPVKEMMNCPDGAVSVSACVSSTVLAVFTSFLMIYAALQ